MLPLKNSLFPALLDPALKMLGVIVPDLVVVDSKTPSTLDFYCDFLEITPREFYEIIEPMRDNSIWKKENNRWQVKDSVFKGRDLTQTKFTSEIFGQDYSEMYFNDATPPKKSGELSLDNFPAQFAWS